jgi:hypothetical protein
LGGTAPEGLRTWPPTPACEIDVLWTKTKNRDFIYAVLPPQRPNPGSDRARAKREIVDVSPRVGAVGGPPMSGEGKSPGERDRGGGTHPPCHPDALRPRVLVDSPRVSTRTCRTTNVITPSISRTRLCLEGFILGRLKGAGNATRSGRFPQAPKGSSLA